MFKTLTLFVIPVALFCADPKKIAPKQPVKPAATQQDAPGIPDGATQVAPYTYSFVDAKGTKWLYRQTPFGIVKMEDKPVVEPVAAKSTSAVATDLGDTVNFQRQTPFGIQTWTKKKADLTDDEKALLDKPAAAPVPSAGAPEKP